ncbi:hypothetical protein WJX75_003075 [Coccomyxa subellipsoidea]|uniref:Hexosyltransferase n=1 Tax=Coccomyxa subellipsoidea TaxID=248742 RepID=A0ABR2Z0W1_9CHLO
MDLEDPRDTSRDRRNTRGLYAWLLDVLKSPWLAVCLIGLLLLVYLGDAEALHRSSLQMKAAGIEAVGALVFYGRRRYVKLLNVYLERNLAQNGGILDEVVFAVRTLDEEDLKFLDLLLARNPGVYRRSAPGSLYQNDTLVHWQESYNIARPDRLYVKIDDDVIFIQDGAIEALVEEKLRGRYLFVSANVVNHPLLSYVHAQLGALLPFQPPPKGLNPMDAYKPFVLANNHSVLDDSPAHTSAYKTDDACFWEQWECAAVAHYSFLHHMRAGSLAAYAFNNWDLCYPDYHRWSINFFLFNSSDLLGDLISNEIDDEVYVSQLLPAFRKQHAAAVGRSALVVHYAYFVQEKGLLYNAPGLLQEYSRVAERYANGTILQKEVDEKPLNGTFGLVLPNDKVVPLEDPNDQMEVAQKTATLGGEFSYYDKDYVEYNGTDIRLG